MLREPVKKCVENSTFDFRVMLVGACNQLKALIGAFSVIVKSSDNLRLKLYFSHQFPPLTIISHLKLL